MLYKLNQYNNRLLQDFSQTDDLMPLYFLNESNLLNKTCSLKFYTYKFEYFGFLTLFHINKISITNKYTIHAIQADLCKNHDKYTFDLYIKKDIAPLKTMNNLSDSPSLFQISAHNHPHIVYVIYFVIKNLIEKKFNTFTVDHIDCILKNLIQFEEDREYLLTKVKEIICKLFGYNKVIETRVEQESVLLLRKRSRYIKYGNLIGIFNELKDL